MSKNLYKISILRCEKLCQGTFILYTILSSPRIAGRFVKYTHIKCTEKVFTNQLVILGISLKEREREHSQIQDSTFRRI
jgi:hypothetical protein